MLGAFRERVSSAREENFTHESDCLAEGLRIETSLPPKESPIYLHITRRRTAGGRHEKMTSSPWVTFAWTESHWTEVSLYYV